MKPSPKSPRLITKRGLTAARANGKIPGYQKGVKNNKFSIGGEKKFY